MAKKNTKNKAPASKPMMAEMLKPANNGTSGCGCGMGCNCNCAAWGLTILRVIVGGTFLWHGITKFMGFAGTKGFFTTLFGAAGPFLAGLVAAVEVLAGIALIIGLGTRWASYALVAIMVVAIVWAKKFAWPAIELDLVFIGALLALAWNGAGKCSMDEKLGCGCGCC